MPSLSPIPGSSAAVRLALLALAAGAACIALSPILVRLSEVGPTVTAFWRAALAVPFLAALVAFSGRAPRAIRAGDRWRLAAAGLFFAGDLAFWHWSIRFTSVANATLFANFAPVFVAAGAWLLFAERPGGRFLAGLALAFAGAFCLLGESLRVGGDHALGDGLGLATALCLSSYLLVVRSLRARLGAAGIMLWTSLATAAVLLPVAWLSGEEFWPATPAGWAVLVGLGLLSHALGQGLIAFALAHLPAGFSALALLLEPVLAALFAWLWLAEGLAVLQWLGGVAVLAGIGVAARGLRGPRRPIADPARRP
ncbi:DMT family transporter [Stella sp.]|uniref:DMT family transporter n=1 Tax=Stella sp. TaxID=2912054 RepID=UPI0035B0AF83